MRHRDRTWTGEVIGTAGGGLVDASWAANKQVAEVGRRGEIRTAEVLDPMALRDGFTILHDLHIPIPGFTANIDHAVVAGRTVLLIDTKAWKPGRYWTMGSTTRRGLRRFEHAATKTPGMAHDHIGRFLSGRGVQAELLVPLIAVWPSSKSGRLSVRWLTMDRCRPIIADTLPRRVRKSLPREPANPAVIAALRALVKGSDSPADTQASGQSHPPRLSRLITAPPLPGAPMPTLTFDIPDSSMAESEEDPFAGPLPQLDAHSRNIFDGEDF